MKIYNKIIPNQLFYNLQILTTTNIRSCQALYRLRSRSAHPPLAVIIPHSPSSTVFSILKSFRKTTVFSESGVYVSGLGHPRYDLALTSFVTFQLSPVSSTFTVPNIPTAFGQLASKQARR